MKALKYHLLLALIASIFVGCDLFFPYAIENAPMASDVPQEPEEPEVPAPDGSFSVARDKFVYFSLGNLQYHAVMNQWRFAPNQYDYVGTDNRHISSSYNGWIDLFGWGTGDSPTKSGGSNSDYSMFIDWGANKIDNDEEGTWRTLTNNEWAYILSERKNASLLIGSARVASVNGIILLPNNWECPSSVTFNSGFDGGFSQNIYSVSKWQLMEEAGAVFLPAAGYRHPKDYPWQSSTTMEHVQSHGYYWSSTSGSHLSFYDCLTYMSNANKWYGCSVRLVKSL